jgi:hypothetical protein
MTRKLQIALFAFYLCFPDFAVASAPKAAGPPDGETKPAVLPTVATERQLPRSPNFLCTKGAEVTLSEINANTELKKNLTAFTGVAFEKDHSYTTNLKGWRKDPGACLPTFLVGEIDLEGCVSYKAAGKSIFHVVDGKVKYLADGREESSPVAVNLTELCSDGAQKMRFKFHYDQSYGPVHAGPWDFTVEIQKNKNGHAVSNTTVVVGGKGKKLPMNKSPIAVIGEKMQVDDISGSQQQRHVRLGNAVP